MSLGQQFSQFNINWLNISPAAIDTGTIVSQRWNTINAAGLVSKLNLQINVPAFTIDWLGIPMLPQREPALFIVGQFNYSFPSRFTLQVPTNYNVINLPASQYIGVIRFQKGSTTYRYILQPNNAAVSYLIRAQPYAGQIIEKNFVIELWAGLQLVEPSPISDTGYLFNTSILLDPNVLPSENPWLLPNVIVSFIDLFTPFPLTPTTVLPTDGPWINN